ncbi:ATP-dependent DNA helicase PcrA [Pseudobythopirellula maris]|uniref:DNA 3'-5' helicase n=1 Tax=Pseudobythopirellula maris TaxID=2527991 RepID=A0A5C5ZR81_9BACT|nr:UvrD-helicase domain-containing protein [Pseudobythopirellula maris]TWT90004.1 ATP-dependent DNA helicase PcrA [Pseudobythopirellula maris]
MTPDDHPLLVGLNDAQRQAVRHLEGPMLVLAGPGSGKTRVVTHRVAHLLSQGVNARQILALTFTNKAADEMRRRLDRLAPGERVWMSTFHRFGAKILRRHGDLLGLAPNFTIYDTTDVRHTLKRVVEAEKINPLHYTADRIAAAISGAKNKLITADEYKPRRESPLSGVVAKVYPAYQKKLLESAAVDFDDLLLHVAKLLHDNAELRAELDERFRYVLVDEYQDTNRAQYVILRALSVDHPNLAATGDPDQSIYGWRGADLNNILEFESDYPEVKVVRLEQNYRSTKSVLRAADALIAHNVKRKAKSLFTDNEEGQPVRLVSYADGDAEARGIAQQIRAAIDSGVRKASDYAIFYRTNALSRAVEKAMRAERVPFQMVRGQEFYQRKEIKDVLAYCQLMNNPRDDLALERTINSPPRGIGKKTIEQLAGHANRFGVTMLDAAREAGLIETLAKRSATAVGKFVTIVDRLADYVGGPVEEAIGAVLTESGYRDHLVAGESEEDENRLANIEELLTDARQFDEENEDPTLEDYLERAWLVNETDSWEDDSDKVTLMTLHAAKGLEFPSVFLIAVEDGILPHERSLRDPVQHEEERRLAFVGITRAEQQLQLSYAQRRDFRGQRRISIPSGFLMELPRDEMEIVDQAPADDWEMLEWQAEQAVADADDFSQLSEEEAAERAGRPKPKPELDLAAIGVKTAASLGGAEQEADDKPPRVSPDVFRVGMAVLHPEFGPGKIATLSGAGQARRATVKFATAGEKRFVLAYSPLRPAGR